MTRPRPQRRLAAILAADVAGYSRLMGDDEDGTLDRLKGLWRDVLVPAAERHRGRVVKVMGEGVLMEFASAVDAVECALALQSGLAEANRGAPDAEPVRLRIGINLGEVIVEGPDLYGQDVNIAARLESIADAGGIFLSASVHDRVQGRTAAAFDDLGLRSLKNIPDPLHVYRVRGLGEPAPLALPDRPSIAVLPFADMSADPEHGHFADGLTEDLITDLSRHPGLFVIARNSTFAYKGRPTDVRQIARDLGVRYVLEGSARRAGGRVRINVQLIDAIGGGHLWAERFDRDLEDVFALQDEVTARIRDALVGQLVAPPPRNRPTSMQAYDLCARGRTLLDTAFGSADALREAMVLLERAIDLDPGYAEAWRCLAMTRNDAWMHCNIPVDPARGSVIDLAQKAVTLDPANSSCRATLALMLDYAGRWDAARAEHEQALALDPNNADAMVMYAEFLLFAGDPARAEALVVRALRNNPFPAAWYHMAQGKTLYALHRYPEAARALRHPDAYRSAARRFLAASLAQMGQHHEARHEAALYLAVNPAFTIAHWVAATEHQHAPTLAHFVDGFRKAGLPEG
jgi:TolB-like protein